jgi:hydroxypyruvate reductase
MSAQLEMALRIWKAGVDAVRGDALVEAAVAVEEGSLWFDDVEVPLKSFRRLAVVGAGKAGAGMARGFEAALGEKLLAEKQVQGWVNVPEPCVERLSRIRLFAARPAGVNEPTEEGVEGSRQIEQLVRSCKPDDLCVCLISGGGSALLPSPIEGVSLAQKRALTKHLSAAGADIASLNLVRRQISRLKGGGLARACNAGRLVTLIISDVMGDPLEAIASGPTIPAEPDPEGALAVLERFGAIRAGVAPEVVATLQKQVADAKSRFRKPAVAPVRAQLDTVVIGNVVSAVDAAGREAERLGLHFAMDAATSLEGSAEEVGQRHANLALRMRDAPGPDCLITGGEPTVELPPAHLRGKGGRNQQAALAALIAVRDADAGASVPGRGIAFVSGGTDGEDGPTDAAGAFFDERILARAKTLPQPPELYLERCDAYNFFEPIGGLFVTGPTHTTVCDLRVLVVDRQG